MKSGFVAILGRPNVGKSTLLNAILNKKISIVTDKAQTTRNNIKGIYNDKDCQIIFVDTPGIHKPNQKLGVQMNDMAYSVAHDVDVSILVVDASKPFGSGDQYIIEHLDIHNSPLIIVINKIDLARINEVQNIKNKYLELFPKAFIFEAVATDKFNLESIVNKIKELLPEGPKFYPEEVISDKDEIFQIKEIIREKVLKELRQEVPHSVAIYMEDIDWESSPIVIKASIVVEKDSQKGIVIGAGGKRIQSIGMKARRDIEKLLNKHVYLELFVKVEEDWRDNLDAIKKYGYNYKEN